MTMMSRPQIRSVNEPLPKKKETMMELAREQCKEVFVACAVMCCSLLRVAYADGDGLGLTPTSVVAICESTNVILYEAVSASPAGEHPLWSTEEMSTNLIRSMERRRVLAAVERIVVSNVYSSQGLSVSEQEIYDRTTNLLNGAFGESAFTQQMASNQQAQVDAILELAGVCVTNSELADEIYQSQFAETMQISTWNRMKSLCQTTNGLTQFEQLYPQEISPSAVSNQFKVAASAQLMKEKVIEELISTGALTNAAGYVQWLYDKLDDVEFGVPELDPRTPSPPAPSGGLGGPEPPLPPAGPVP